MTAQNPQSKPVNTSNSTQQEKVRKAWGSEYDKSDVVYEFSNGRKFESSDRGTTGIYRAS